MNIPRRSLLLATPLAAAPRAAWPQSLSAGAFTHGVASGDPLQNGVIIWTRFTGAEAAWEIAEDESFERVVQRGRAGASLSNDFCIKVDVRGLAPGRRYYYRFLGARGASPTGVTQTAPAGEVQSLRAALFSCANMPYGYFHAYAHAAARDDINIVLHAGDYIYETPRGRYPTEAEAVAGRAIEPIRETVTLNDYYQRYASYHTDAALLELRRTKPIAAVWDDHELVDNAWREGALHHNERYEGAYADRIAAAAKAYFDWMPIRAPGGLRIYRHIDWGNLARIILLDARQFGRDQQIDYRRAFAPRLAQGGADAVSAVASFRREVLDDPSRTMLGQAQEEWFNQTLAASKARGQRWQIIVQQVVMGAQAAPSDITRLLPAGVSSNTRRWFAAGEQASGLGLPWNLDAWDGYPAARERFLEACAHHRANALVLGGDSHNCWANNLERDGRRAAIEFSGGSVTSPGVERPLTNAAPGEREAALRGANPHLAWCDLTHRGYAALTFSHAGCETEWRAFSDVRSPRAGAAQTTRLQAAASNAAGPGAWQTL